MTQRIEVDTNTFIRFWLVIIGLGVAAILIYKALAGLIIVGISIFLAIAIRPLALRIHRMHKKIDQTRATILAYVAVVLVFGLIFATIGPVIMSETANFIKQLPSLTQKTIGGEVGMESLGRLLGVSGMGAQIQSGLEEFSRNFVSNFGSTVVTSVSVVAEIATSVILTLVLTFLFLLQGPAISDQLWKILAKQKDETITITKRILGRMIDVISKYVYGQVLVAMLDGAVVTVSLIIFSWLFKFPTGLAFPFGMIAMIGCLIPMFGPIIGCALISTLLLFSSLNIWVSISFLIFYGIYQQIENNIIAPRIQGDALHLPPLIILISVTIGIYAFGLIGAILAIPLAGCGKVLLEEYPNIRKLRAT